MHEITEHIQPSQEDSEFSLLVADSKSHGGALQHKETRKSKEMIGKFMPPDLLIQYLHPCDLSQNSLVECIIYSYPYGIQMLTHLSPSLLSRHTQAIKFIQKCVSLNSFKKHLKDIPFLS